MGKCQWKIAKQKQKKTQYVSERKNNTKMQCTLFKQKFEALRPYKLLNNCSCSCALLFTVVVVVTSVAAAFPAFPFFTCSRRVAFPHANLQVVSFDYNITRSRYEYEYEYYEYLSSSQCSQCSLGSATYFI